MSQINNNGMDCKAVATNNNNGVSANNNINNNIETLKGLIIAGHDGAKDYGAGENGLTFGFKWGEYNIFVSRTYGMWLVSLYKNYKSEWTPEGRRISYDAQILDRRLGDYARGKRWSMSLAENMANFILDAIADYEQQEQQDMERFDNEEELMQACVLRYQSEFDGYMSDLHMVAENYADVTDRWTAMLVSDIIGRMAQLGSDLLESLGDITGCDMVEDDGYWLDTTDLCRWHGGTDDFYVDDMQDLVDTLNYMSTADSGLPLGLEQDSIDWIIMGEGNAYCGLQPLYTGETAYNFVMENV